MDKSILGSPFAGCVLSAKKAEWLKNGRVTHSDAQFLASSLLRGAHGKVVRGIVARRFPVILVDEFQDTGYFLGRALLSLLETPTVHGAVVGDPDQAIFQFGGAEKCLFEAAERVAGRSGIVLDESHRCPRKVAAVATALSRSGKPVTSLARASEGRAVIVVHDQKEEDLGAVLAGLGDVLAERTATVLARKTVTVRRLGRGLAPRECPSGCKFGRGMSRAAERLLAGDPTLAARITWKELGGLVLGDEDVDLDGLRERSIYSLAWRKACHAVLFEAVLAPAGESWNTWAKRLRERVRREAESLLHPVEKLGTRIRGFGGDGDGARYADWGTGSSSPLAEVMTVHQAKGREFPAVVFYTPKPHKKNAPCPSVEWWSAEPGSEEREIAFVACSRSEDLLVLAVHRDTFNSLDQLRPDFVRLFEAVNELPPAAQKTPMRRSKKASADDEVDPNHRE
jgi:DNA helicase-2/ATP-dependent DNA helicase PcrA